MTSRRHSARRTGRTYPRALATLLAAVHALAVTLAAMMPAQAQQGIPLIRDTEIEALLRDYSRPILRAARQSDNIRMRVVNSDSFNAFVMDGQSVYMHTGAVMQSDTPNQLIGVIAHETGHIEGSHPAALRANLKKAQNQQMLLMLLGIGLMVGGAMSGGDGARDLTGVGQGVLVGGESLVLRSFLLERRNQEGAADLAGFGYLTTTKQSGRGMLETFERLAQSNVGSYGDPYMQSHPTEAARLNNLRNMVEKSPYYDVRDPPELQLRHDLVRAKLYGFTTSAGNVQNRYPASNTSLPARYARAIARNCSGRCATSMAEVDALTRDRPDNPYFWELKGHLLFYGGKPREAAAPFRKALEVLRGAPAPLIQIQLAQALVASSDSTETTNEVIQLLERAIAFEKEDPTAYRLLATAYYKKQMVAEAELAQAEVSLLNNDAKQAYNFAKRAQTQLKADSPKRQRAEDILLTTRPK